MVGVAKNSRRPASSCLRVLLVALRQWLDCLVAAEQGRMQRLRDAVDRDRQVWGVVRGRVRPGERL